MEELCCLYAAAQLSQDELIEFTRHLQTCSDCKTQVREYEKLILFELSIVSAQRMEHKVPELIDFTSEQSLLTKVRGRARTLQAQRESEADPGSLAGRNWARGAFEGKGAILSRRVIPWIGWATAALLLLAIRAKTDPPKLSQTTATSSSQDHAAYSEISELQRDLAASQEENKEALRKLKEAEASARSSQTALTQLLAQSRSQDAKGAVSDAERDKLRADLAQRSAELEIARSRLKEEISAKDAMQEQLADVNLRIEKQRSEVARLQELGATARTPLPVATVDLSSSEAKEILGARDLHIVDVYDVDNGGKSSKVYGRVYYVNRSLLIFYAFDLSNAQKNRKAVAFQAWGFRQPRSTSAESLGLFYMDNASLNRWALRVSDPQLLSRIDTLFVTLEPVGGSPTPKGQKLLMASLAGPANHP
jgi:hypothetical protein